MGEIARQDLFWLRAFFLRGRATLQRILDRFFVEECYFCGSLLEGAIRLEFREGCGKETKLLGHTHHACVRRNRVEPQEASCWADGLGYCLPVKGLP